MNIKRVFSSIYTDSVVCRPFGGTVLQTDNRGLSVRREMPTKRLPSSSRPRTEFFTVTVVIAGNAGEVIQWGWRVPLCCSKLICKSEVTNPKVYIFSLYIF